jgi:transcription antitermination protein NusB
VSKGKKKLDVSARRASRLGAVQAAYQMDLGGTPSEEVIDEFVDHRLGQELEGDQYNEPDIEHFTKLIRGVVAEQVVIDRAIENNLAKGWTMTRLDSTLRAILRCGVFEILNMKTIPAPIVIDEYIDLTKAFFEGPEPKFVNGLLDGVAKAAK